jgi:hypothetical protein
MDPELINQSCVYFPNATSIPRWTCEILVGHTACVRALRCRAPFQANSAQCGVVMFVDAESSFLVSRRRLGRLVAASTQPLMDAVYRTGDSCTMY